MAAHIKAIPLEEGDLLGTEWKPIRRFVGIGSFGTSLAHAGSAGDVLTHDHDETDARHEELFQIVSGHAMFRADGEEIDAPAGTFLYVPDPAAVCGAVAREADTVMFTVGAELGAVFAPSEWDTEPLPD